MDLVVIEFKWGRGTFLALFLLLDMTSYSFVLQRNVKFSLVTSHNRAKFGADSKRGSQIIKRLHCVKSVRIKKIQTTKNSVFGNFSHSAIHWPVSKKCSYRNQYSLIQMVKGINMAKLLDLTNSIPGTIFKHKTLCSMKFKGYQKSLRFLPKLDVLTFKDNGIWKYDYFQNG